MDLVPLAQAAQDADRLLDRRLVDEDRLEAALERGVLLDVLAVLVEGRRADRVQLAAGEHRLEQVGGVHGALGGARPDDRVQLVDEQDDPALGVLDLLEDGLEPLLELAPELGPGDERAEIERDDPLVLEPLGHVAADDPLGEPLGDGRLADARLADEDRVVLRPARQDLDDPPDLVVAADDRVELAGARLGGQVAAVLLERGVGALGVLRGDPLAAADALERLEQGLAAGCVTLEQGLALAADLGDRRAAGARSRRTRRRAGVASASASSTTRRARGSIDSEPPWMRARRARIAASSPRNPGRSTPSRRSVSAGMPSSGSTSADRMCSASRIGLSRRWAVAWASRMASWAFWVNRSSCMVGCFPVGGSRSARVGLLDEVEEGPGGRRRLVGQVGRQDDPGLDVQVAVPGRP